MTTMMTQTLSELPADSDSLYTVELDGSTIGIGTPSELRELISDGILSLNDPLRFRLVRGDHRNAA
jgi:hypothetical protein